ncbi:hypothetical protein B0H19DRAFT_1348225 [Mycena capillaripes]|nr:hypothetical protein B0H19DRAFT_1348225 [Mycena capillaripes]
MAPSLLSAECGGRITNENSGEVKEWTQKSTAGYAGCEARAKGHGVPNRPLSAATLCCSAAAHYSNADGVADGGSGISKTKPSGAGIPTSARRSLSSHAGVPSSGASPKRNEIDLDKSMPTDLGGMRFRGAAPMPLTKTCLIWGGRRWSADAGGRLAHHKQTTPRPGPGVVFVQRTRMIQMQTRAEDGAPRAVRTGTRLRASTAPSLTRPTTALAATFSGRSVVSAPHAQELVFSGGEEDSRGRSRKSKRRMGSKGKGRRRGRRRWEKERAGGWDAKRQASLASPDSDSGEETDGLAQMRGVGVWQRRVEVDEKKE